MMIIPIILVILLLIIIFIFNSLIKSKTQCAEGWADIDVQLKRRYDLIPNLIETVKGYANHEKELLEKITLARANAMKAGTMTEHAVAENALSETLKSLFAVSENYPDLKASTNFAKLQDELADTENKIQAARRFYNSLARDYNIKLEIFPHRLLANLLKLTAREFFTITDEKERENIKAQF